MKSKPACSRPLLIICWLVAVGLSGCTALHRPDAGLTTPVCERDRSICSMDGRVMAAHPWEAKIEVAGGCIAILVPDSFSSVAATFDGKRARVAGQMVPQPTGEAMPYYVVRGMRVNANSCLAAVVVFSIDGEDGSHWEIESAEYRRVPQ